MDNTDAFDTFKEKICALQRKTSLGRNEDDTFDIRRGVLGNQIEMFCGGLALALEYRKVQLAIEQGVIDSFCNTQLERLRGKTWSRVDPTPFSLRSLLLERLQGLKELYQELNPDKNADMEQKIDEREIEPEAFDHLPGKPSYISIATIRKLIRKFHRRIIESKRAAIPCPKCVAMKEKMDKARAAKKSKEVQVEKVGA